jgi:hypothetical protein
VRLPRTAQVASVVSNLGVNTQKLSLMREARRRAAGPRAYCRQPLWLLGLGLVVLGSLGDFAALGFAAQSLVTPVGAVTMVANLLFASAWLGEELSRRDVGATGLIVVGAVGAAAFADKSEQCYRRAPNPNPSSRPPRHMPLRPSASAPPNQLDQQRHPPPLRARPHPPRSLDELVSLYRQPGFLAYACAVAAACLGFWALSKVRLTLGSAGKAARWTKDSGSVALLFQKQSHRICS